MKKFMVLLRFFHIILLQDLVDQAMCIERKIQQKAHGRSYASHSNVAPWSKQQSGTSFGGGRSQGVVARPSPSIATSKMEVSTASSLANQQWPATSAATQPLLWPLLPLHVAEKLCATSARVLDMLLPNV
jgi:hypothetical protein